VKLKIAGIRAISALVALAAIVLSIPSIALTDLFPEPLNYAALVAIGLAFLFSASYIVFRNCALDRLE